MRAAIIIPARLESTRLPGKLLLADTGRPLICHTVERAAAIRDASSGMFTQVLVAADDMRIVVAVREEDERRGWNVRAVMTDSGHQSGSDRIAEVAAGLGEEVDAVLNLQGDEPEVPVDAVLELGKFFASSGGDVATMVYPLTAKEDRANPALVKVVMGEGGRTLYFSRADIPYRRDDAENLVDSYGHVGIYLYRRDALERFVRLKPGRLERTEKLEQLRALENNMSIHALVMDEKPPKGIDTPEDYAAFVAAMRKQ